MKRFLLDRNYGAYLTGAGFGADAVLKRADLPEDLFDRQTPSLTAAEYFRLMQAVDDLSPDGQTPVRLASGANIEAFSPPIFAAYCSENGLTCLKRLAQYKPLIGALRYQMEEGEREVALDICAEDGAAELPEILTGSEFVFLVALLRKATGTPVTPLSATAKRPMSNGSYGDFIGVPIASGEQNRLVFSKEDVLRPFVSRNDSMWEFFQPELKRRLDAAETDDSCAAQVRSALMELLPKGMCTIDAVAERLGCGRRSLQRRLKEESTSFQKQLNHTRELLAKTYLSNTDMTTQDIAFLLGYQETGSFLRAFSLWTGQTTGEYRDK